MKPNVLQNGYPCDFRHHGSEARVPRSENNNILKANDEYLKRRKCIIDDSAWDCNKHIPVKENK
jgi:hypothetical protein